MTGLLALTCTLLLSLLGPQAAPRSLHPIVTLPTDQTVLGSIADMDVLPNGDIVVLDEQAKQLLVFSREGGLVRTIGREGQGPGEIGGAGEVEVTADGHIWIVDYGNTRITRWDAGGALLGSTRLSETLGTLAGWPHELVVNDGGAFLKVSQFVPGSPIRVFRLEEDLTAIADTLLVMIPDGEAATCLFCPISVGPGGRVFAAAGDTASMGSELGRDGAPRASFRLEGVPAVRRTADEQARLEAAAGRLRLGEGQAPRKVTFPPHKPRFLPHSMGVDDQGGLWLAPTVAEGAATIFYRFAPEGHLDATLPAPDHLNGFKIRGGHLMGIGETALGEPVVRVYEIRNPNSPRRPGSLPHDQRPSPAGPAQRDRPAPPGQPDPDGRGEVDRLPGARGLRGVAGVSHPRPGRGADGERPGRPGWAHGRAGRSGRRLPWRSPGDRGVGG